MHTRCPVRHTRACTVLSYARRVMLSDHPDRSGYLMRRLRHAVSRPCDAICAVLDPSAVLRLVRCGRCCSHTLQSTPCSTFVGPRRSIRMSSSGTSWPKRMPGSAMLRMKRSRAVSCLLYRPLTARPPADRFAIFAGIERSSASSMTSSSEVGRFSDIVTTNEALHQCAATLRCAPPRFATGAATLSQAPKNRLPQGLSGKTEGGTYVYYSARRAPRWVGGSPRASLCPIRRDRWRGAGSESVYTKCARMKLAIGLVVSPLPYRYCTGCGQTRECV